MDRSHKGLQGVTPYAILGSYVGAMISDQQNRGNNRSIRKARTENTTLAKDNKKNPFSLRFNNVPYLDKLTCNCFFVSSI